ncbi:MAG: SnoaL-like domain-containing protein [Acidimicrobiia bacterium]|nr:SnoaL-like domain-containing protein [Acidimicrobiia bacterium]
MTLSADDVQIWLDAYVAAWRSGDPGDIRALFCDDAEYCYQPWGEPVVGADAIVNDWLKDRDESEVWQAHYQPELVDGTRAVAIGETVYPDEGRTYANLFLLEFNEDKRCCSFTEWFMKHPKPRD